MRTTRVIPWLSIGVLLASSMVILADGPSFLMPTPTETQSPKDREAQIFKLLADHRCYIKEMCKILQDSSVNLQWRVSTIYLLGELRATDAVPFLVNIIDLDASPIMEYTSIQWQGRWPAQTALTKIGIPAVKGILEKVPFETNATKKRLMFVSIRQVLGSQTGFQFVDEYLSGNTNVQDDVKQKVLDEYRTVNQLKGNEALHIP